MYFMPGNLISRIKHGLLQIDMPVDGVVFELRPYSVSYYGRYIPGRNGKCARILIYPYADKKGNMYSFQDIFRIVIHEMTHHCQYNDPSFRRIKGVMHNTQFWEIYNHYIQVAEQRRLLFP